MLREIWEDLKDLGEYATRGFVEEVIMGKDNYVPTYEKNRLANSMVNSARHDYHHATEQHNRRIETIKQRYKTLDKFKQKVLIEEIHPFERYISSTSFAGQLSCTKKTYFRKVPIQQRFNFDITIPSAPRGNFELTSPLLFFRLEEAEDNYNSAKELQLEIRRETEKLKLRTEALKQIINKIEEFEEVFRIIYEQLAIINRKINAIGNRIRKDTLELGMIYVSLLYILMSTDIMKNDTINPESKRILEYVKSEIEV